LGIYGQLVGADGFLSFSGAIDSIDAIWCKNLGTRPESLAGKELSDFSPL
jgi:hypothetical protein